MGTVKGRIHALETGGMVDGPGIRFVAFLQGCPLRCLYCHNPDSWAVGKGREMTAQELVDEAWKYRTYMKASGGGITLSGGEPLFQPEFVLDVIRIAHEKGMTVAIDTSGYGNPERVRNCLDEADLIILDIKTALAEKHRDLTGITAERPRAILEYLKQSRKPLWVRHVVVPGLTDSRENLEALKEILTDIPSLEKFEFLPFHKMGEEKWEQEGLLYKLGGTLAPDQGFMDRISEDFRRAGIPM
ncbi:pyruvate formate-lyase-activating protein [Spirochaeta isovalerica]|uniref:Pyruvate formate-lyase-activating enzyme n=1 Tax=Spirochaeta isovalerica TaxID=150 RepID=A0A841REM0_9SPIO|nr:pyruvate formate-lyase-activating protein [Spirochaeta isovalerica]MBB6482525.1 pyruvate formate lyase activating enzyme [Spirochaeta isovalerica]